MITGSTPLSERVTQALLNDDRTRDAIIDVTIEGGKVTLSGSVASEETRQAAEEITREQNGVVLVIDELIVS